MPDTSSTLDAPSLPAAPDPALYALATRAGIALSVHDALGQDHVVSDATLRAVLAAMGLAATDAAAVEAALAKLAGGGEHREGGAEDGPSGVLGDGVEEEGARGDQSGGEEKAMAAAECFLPESFATGERLWGVSCQLYSLTTARNWGIGDFSDLAVLVRRLAEAGADAVAVNPLHAIFPSDPTRFSPYAPSNRLLLNPLYIDPETVPDYAESADCRNLVSTPNFQALLAALRRQPLVDYRAVGIAKDYAFRHLFAHFRAQHLDRGGDRNGAYQAFVASTGRVLRDHARFEALAEHFGAAAWDAWPPEYHDPDGPAVAAFAAAHADDVHFHQYLQWEADRQLAAAQTAALDAGMAIGLYRDLAVGCDGGGSEAWGLGTALARGVSVGAPPDAFNRSGQDWGLPPLNPLALVHSKPSVDSSTDAATPPFQALVAANMRHTGGLRVDHVMGLERLYWIPHGTAASAGTYVTYPFRALLVQLAAASQTHRCIVVGEDLGTVPEGLREDLQRANILSTRLLLFERDANGDFLPPTAYPRQAVASFGSHDLPPVAGWWAGRDLEVRAEPQAGVDDRANALAKLGEALRAAGVLSADVKSDAPPIAAIHAFLGKTPCYLVLAQLEDLAGMTEQMNLPGTVHEHPNWRRKLPGELEGILARGEYGLR